MPTIIVDLDNCISNDGWRRSQIKWHLEDMDARYANYHKSCLFDEFCNQELVTDKNSNILIFSARPSIYRGLTEKWIKRNAIKANWVFLRGKGDKRKSVDVKRDMLHHLNLADDIIAYDDRQEIVDMYLENGIRAELKKINTYLR